MGRNGVEGGATTANLINFPISLPLVQPGEAGLVGGRYGPPLLNHGQLLVH